MLAVSDSSVCSGHSPTALGGQRTAAVSPAGVIFHTTLEKLSSPQISWGSAHKKGKCSKKHEGFLSDATPPTVAASTHLDTSFRYRGGPLLVLRDTAVLQRRGRSRSCFSAASPHHTFWCNLTTRTKAAICRPLRSKCNKQTNKQVT